MRFEKLKLTGETQNGQNPIGYFSLQLVGGIRTTESLCRNSEQKTQRVGPVLLYSMMCIQL